MSAESSIARDPLLSNGSFVIDDVNDAYRRFVLAQVPIIIHNISYDNTLANSKMFDLPGRNSFIVEATTSVHLYASINGTSWTNLDSTAGAHLEILSQHPWRFFRIVASGNTTGTASFAAVKA